MFRRLHETGETLTVLVDGLVLRVKRETQWRLPSCSTGKPAFAARP